MKNILFLLCLTTVLISWRFTHAQQPTNIQHIIAAIEKDRFHGWPANNGAWQWGNEFLVGFTQGDFNDRDGHNIAGIEQSMFTRSLDGGETWQMFDPENFLDDDNIKWLPKGKKNLSKPIDFSHRGFALRVFATGYHGNDDPEGGFYFSYNRGQTWNGPFKFGKLNDHAELVGKVLTPRTDYKVLGKKECLVFITARVPSQRVACIKTTDGGMSFDFLSWVTPASADFNAIMPCTVQLSPKKFLLTFRKINHDKSVLESTIDAYLSTDLCETWQYLSTIKEIKQNSNPPAIVKLADGRLCCIYGDRDIGKICGKYSHDEGKTWGAEFILRDDYVHDDDWADMGYPRLLQRDDGKLVAMYYWATEKHPQHHIAATIWQP